MSEEGKKALKFWASGCAVSEAGRKPDEREETGESRPELEVGSNSLDGMKGDDIPVWKMVVERQEEKRKKSERRIYGDRRNAGSDRSRNLI